MTMLVGSERAAKVEKLRDKGIDPYPHSFEGSVSIRTILDTYDPSGRIPGSICGDSNDHMRITGRIVGQRGHGKTSFLDIQDVSGTIQIYARADDLGDHFEQIKDLDLGDIVGIDGSLYVTKRQQLSLQVRHCTLLAKCLVDPPDFYHGIRDPEIKYRHRELDLMANPESRQTFLLRSKLVSAIRSYLAEKGWMELETPILQTLPGGALARPFVTHHQALGRDLYLRTATELYLKRAIIGGLENVYEFGRFFRNEGMSPQHNPEFTMLELFVNGADYNGVMNFTEELVAAVIHEVLSTTEVEYKGETINFDTPWPKISLRHALAEEIGHDIIELSQEDLSKIAGKAARPNDDWASLVNTLQRKLIEPKLIQPTWLIDLPKDLWPLVKGHSESDLTCEAFDGFIAGMEIAGGGTDINDPVEQRERFVRQRERQEAGTERDPHPHDEEFVKALEYGMPPASGVGLGLDRLLMILTQSDTLRDVLMYPAMREIRQS